MMGMATMEMAQKGREWFDEQVINELKARGAIRDDRVLSFYRAADILAGIERTTVSWWSIVEVSGDGARWMHVEVANTETGDYAVKIDLSKVESSVQGWADYSPECEAEFIDFQFRFSKWGRGHRSEAIRDTELAEEGFDYEPAYDRYGVMVRDGSGNYIHHTYGLHWFCGLV
jgi:hypothetical protein